MRHVRTGVRHMRFLRIGVLFLVIVAAFAVASTVGAAGNGSASVIPASSTVPQGGTVDIGVVIDPPAVGTSIWIVKVAYNPNVVQVTGCTWLTIPPTVAGAAGCDTQDTNSDLIDDTAVALGGLIQNVGGTPHGFETTQTVATFTFKAIGAPGSQSPLHVTVTAMLGPNGEQESPTTNDGVIQVIQGPSPTVAPVGGTVEMVSAAPGQTALSTRAIALAVVVIGAAATFVAWRRARLG